MYIYLLYSVHVLDQYLHARNPLYCRAGVPVVMGFGTSTMQREGRIESEELLLQLTPEIVYPLTLLRCTQSKKQCCDKTLKYLYNSTAPRNLYNNVVPRNLYSSKSPPNLHHVLKSPIQNHQT